MEKLALELVQDQRIVINIVSFAAIRRAIVTIIDPRFERQITVFV